jgi:hypothetical protein
MNLHKLKIKNLKVNITLMISIKIFKTIKMNLEKPKILEVFQQLKWISKYLIRALSKKFKILDKKVSNF